MKPILSHRFVVLLCLFALQIAASAQPATTSSPTWQVYFSPRGAATSATTQALDNAKSSVLIQAYSFTSVPIAEALVRAHVRGIRIQVLLDKSQKSQKCAAADILAKAGVPILIDAAHAIAHNKVMVIDNEIVVTGSFNFTKAAEERNAENLLVFHDRELAARYAENWHFHQGHSEPYNRTSKDNQRLALPTRRTRSRN